MKLSDLAFVSLFFVRLTFLFSNVFIYYYRTTSYLDKRLTMFVDIVKLTEYCIRVHPMQTVPVMTTTM